jgi:molybdenum cofactor cytidylyltransferase
MTSAKITGWPSVAAVILAAGRSSRFADGHKLLALHAGKPLLRHVAEAAIASMAAEVVVVTGDDADEISKAVAGLAVRLVHNPDFAAGQASSVRSGIEALRVSSEAAVVLLGDMPAVTAEVIDLVISAYRPAEGALVVVPTHLGKRGNPVLWSRRYFPVIAALNGDRGARSVLGMVRAAVVTVEAGPSVLIDVDTVASLNAFGLGTTASD